MVSQIKDGDSKNQYKLTLLITSTESWVDKANVSVTITNSEGSIEERIQLNKNTEETETTSTVKPEITETGTNSSNTTAESGSTDNGNGGNVEV